MPIAARRRAKGIGRPGGSRPDGEDAANGVELVGERRDGARKVTRQVVVGETRTIVIGDSERDLGRLAGESARSDRP